MVLNVHNKTQGLLGTGKLWEGGMEVGEEGDATMTPALRWAAMSVILIFH